MTADPSFSVVLPTFNRSALLTRAVDSVLAQTYPHWELLVVDDGSTDDTEHAVRERSGGDERVRYLRLPNMGAPVARNVGIGVARHPWIAFLDSDDWWPATKLEVVAREVRPDRPVVYTGWSFFAEPDTVLETVIEPPPADLLGALLANNPINALPAFVVQRRLLLEIGGFDIRFKARQDVDLYVRLAERSPFHFVPKALCMVSLGDRDRISTEPGNRLDGFDLFVRKHGAALSLVERSYLHKRAAAQALRARRWSPAVRHGLLAVPSFASTRLQSLRLRTAPRRRG